MPIYEYHCQHCAKDFERFQKVTDPPIVTCPDCQRKVKRVVSRTSFSLKGSGWYKDGYSSSPPGAKEEKTKKAETPKSPEKKAET